MVEQQCSICLDHNEDEDLIRPCHCRRVHRECLNQWRALNHQNYLRCEICQYDYKLSRVWWAGLLSHSYVVFSLTTLGFVSGSYLAGLTSASTYNGLWYWFHHQAYLPPPRLQMAFHALGWVGIPGLYMGLRDCLQGPALATPPRSINIQLPQPHPWWAPSSVQHHHHYDQVLRRRSDEVKAPEDQKEEDQKKPTVAPYEEKSAILWFGLAVGAAYALRQTFVWTYGQASRLCARAQDIVENVQ